MGSAGIHTDILSNILFGITGGLLSLVGLVAIFVSINSQHSIEKARELMWELQSFDSHTEADKETASTIRRNINHYSRLTKLNYPVLIVVIIAICTIVFVGLSWMFYYSLVSPLLTAPNEREYTLLFLLITVVLLIFFIVQLILLTKILLIGGLPHPSKLNDIHSKIQHIEVARLVGLSSYIFFHRDLYYVDLYIQNILEDPDVINQITKEMINLECNILVESSEESFELSYPISVLQIEKLNDRYRFHIDSSYKDDDIYIEEQNRFTNDVIGIEFLFSINIRNKKIMIKYKKENIKREFISFPISCYLEEGTSNP
jgi:hypothetical protein